MRLALSIIVLAFALLTPRVSSAGEFAVIPASCTPARGNLAPTSTYYTSVSMIYDPPYYATLTCAVTFPNDIQPSHIWFAYVDSSGSSADHVTMFYQKMNKYTGAITDISELDSKGSPCSSGFTTLTTCTTTFGDTFDPSTYVYWVLINLYQSTSALPTPETVWYGVIW